MMVFRASELLAKNSRAAQGVTLMKLKKGHRVISACVLEEGMLSAPERYRARTLPSSGQLPQSDESGEQITFS